MLDKLEGIEQRFIALEQSLMEPGTAGKELARLTKERAGLEEIVAVYRRFKIAQRELEEAREMGTSEDVEMRALAKEEIERLRTTLEELKQELTLLMLP